jgi:hypothetical protein
MEGANVVGGWPFVFRGHVLAVLTLVSLRILALRWADCFAFGIWGCFTSAGNRGRSKGENVRTVTVRRH